MDKNEIEKKEPELAENIGVTEDIDKPDAEPGEESSDETAVKRTKKLTGPALIRLAALAVIAVAMFAYVKLADTSGEYIMVFDGKKISTEDFYMFYRLGQNTDADMALEVLTNYMVIGKAAKQNGITLTEQETLDLDEYANYIRTFAEENGIEMPLLTPERMKEIISVDYLYPKLAEAMTESYVVDEADFESSTVNEWEHYKDSFGGGSEASDEFIEMYREYYIQLKKYELFDGLIAGWKTDANVKVNEKVFDMIKNQE